MEIHTKYVAPKTWQHCIAITLLLLFAACANTNSKTATHQPFTSSDVETKRQQGVAVKTVTPIFSQLVMFTLPAEFTPVFADTQGNSYIQESVLAGEGVEKWSQMITVTGAKNLTLNSHMTPQVFAGGIAKRFNEVCPTAVPQRFFKIQTHFVAVAFRHVADL